MNATEMDVSGAETGGEAVNSTDNDYDNSLDNKGDATSTPRKSPSRPPPTRDKPPPGGNRPRPPLPKKPPVARKPDKLSVSPSGNASDSPPAHPTAQSGSPHVNSHTEPSSHQQISPLSNHVHNNDTPSVRKNRAEDGMYAAGKSLFYIDQSPTEEKPKPSFTQKTPRMKPASPSKDACATEKSPVSSKTPPKIIKRRSLTSPSCAANPVSGSVFYAACDAETNGSSEDANPSGHAISVSGKPGHKQTVASPSTPATPSPAKSPISGDENQKKIAPKISPKPSPKPHPRPPPKPVPRKKIPPSPVQNKAPAFPASTVDKKGDVSEISAVSETKKDTTSNSVLSEDSHNNNQPSESVPSNLVQDSGKTDGNENVILSGNNLDNSPELHLSAGEDIKNESEVKIPEDTCSTNINLNSSPSQKVSDTTDSSLNANVASSENSIADSNVQTSCYKQKSKVKMDESDDENTCDMLKEIEDILIKSLGSENILGDKTPKSKESSGTASTGRGTGPHSLKRQSSVGSLDGSAHSTLERQGSVDSIGSQSAPGTPQRPPRPRRIASQLLKQFSLEGPSLPSDDDSTAKTPSFKKPCPPKPKRANAPRGARSQSDVTGMLDFIEKQEIKERESKRPGLPARHQSFSPGDEPPPLPPRNSSRRVSLDGSDLGQLRDSSESVGTSTPGKSVPIVPTRTSIPPGSQAPFPKPARSVRARPRPTRQAPPPPPHPPAQRKTSQDAKSSSLERSSSQHAPVQRLSKQYKKIEISETKKTCVATESSSDKDDSFDHDYHEIGEHPKTLERVSPSKQTTPPPSLPPRSYQPPAKPRHREHSDEEHNRSDEIGDSKDTSDNASCSSDGSQARVSLGDHLDHLDVSTPKFSRPRPVSNASQFSTNSSGSGEAFTSPPGHDLSSEEDDEENKDDEIYQQRKRDRKVFYIAEEIKKSEEVFVDVLKLLNIDFRNHITKAAEKYDHSLIPNETLNKILDYLPQLHNFNADLLQDLTQRIEKWSENPMLADIFVKKGPFLKLYSSYIRNFENATALLEEACKRHPEFQKLVRDFEMSPRCANLAIKHYMLKPIQRIPQYKLLLQDYLKHLQERSPDYGHTKTALNIVSEVADHANESMRHGDTVQKLLEIQHSLIGQFEVIQPGRNLIKHGELQKLSRKELQPRMFYLFNDVLLYTTPVSGGYRLNNILPLTGMKVSTPQQEAFSNEFSIISVQRSFTVAASTLEERDEWLKVLTAAIEEITSRRHTFETMRQGPQTSLLDKDFVLGHKAPLWVPDARVTMCMLCLGEFTVTWRRHHCRACGRVVCGYCSDNKAPLRYLKYRSARVCDDCFEKLAKVVDEEDGKIEDDVSEAGSISTPVISLKSIKERFQKIRKSGRKTHVKRPAVLKEVHANDEGSVMSGYLKVLKNKRWKKLWFVVKDKVLYTYKASEDMAAIESLPLLGFEVTRTTVWVEGAEPDLVFQLTHSNTQPHIFCTDSAAATEKWLTVMRQSSVA